jgi:formamidopyrimidine-DNA glycosylase
VPELPEVEIQRRSLARWVAGETVTAIEVVDPALVGLGEIEALGLPAAIGSIARRGKLLLVDIHPAAGESAVLAIHLRMTGKIVRVPVGAPDRRFTRATLHLSSGARLQFVDPRRLGRWGLGAMEAALAWAGADRWGPDALLEPSDAAALASRVGRGRQPIKVALMDQQRIAGLGNIAASEICFLAGVAPSTPAGALPAEAWARLAPAVTEFLNATIEAEESEEIAYIQERGAPNPFRVYGRRGEPCPRCEVPIQRAVFAGRSTYFCAACQR